MNKGRHVVHMDIVTWLQLILMCHSSNASQMTRRKSIAYDIKKAQQHLEWHQAFLS